MNSFPINNGMDYDSFLKATAYIQEYTRRQIGQGRNNFGFPNEMSYHELSGLMTSIRDFIQQQQQINAKIEKFMESQKTINSYVLDRFAKCKCKCADDPNVIFDSIMTPKIEPVIEVVEEKKIDPLIPFNMHTPCASTSFQQLPVISRDQPTLSTNIGIELIKMTQQLESSQDCDVDVMSDEKCSTSYDNSFIDNPGEINALDRKNWMTEKKPYKCPECEKEFRQKHGLQQHMQTHDSVGAFFCDICGKRYTRQESVNRHKRTTQCSKSIMGVHQMSPISTSKHCQMPQQGFM